MLNWAIFDLDGTLADTAWRNHLAVARNWYWFHAGIPLDLPRPAETALLRAWVAGDPREHNRVALVTGRPERYRNLTEEWLDKHRIHWDALYMRPNGDRRSDIVVKGEIHDLMIREGKSNIIFAIEDRDQVVEMWRSRGITCFQCQPGAY